MAASEALSSLTAISLLLKPRFDTNGHATQLTAKYTIQAPKTKSKQPFLVYEIWRGNVPAHPYTPSDVHASDDAGPVAVDFVPTPGKEKREQNWFLQRDAVGDLVLEAQVYPREVDSNTPLGSRADLRTDNGGLQGAGRWFLPKLRLGEDSAVYLNHIEWDLRNAPGGTRAVSSLGEGPGRVTLQGPAETLTNAVYMVGPIQSYPPEPRPGSEPGFCGTYWFGQLPSNLDRLKTFNNSLYTPMASMFGMTDGSYRVFIRHVASGYGGSGFRDSYVMEYSDRVHEEEDNEIQWLWAHEMVHSFALMDFEENGTFNAWYTEGLAEFYSIFLPFRFGLLPASYVGRLVNGKLSGYGTNPQMNISEREAYLDFFSNWYSEKISYNRGLAYILLLDSRLRTAYGITDAKAQTLLDVAVIDLAQRRRRDGVKILQKDFLAHVASWFGGSSMDYEQELQDMVAGKTIDLSSCFVGNPENALTLTSYGIQQIGWDCSRDRTEAGHRVVSEVVPGTNAEVAGLRVGDPVINRTRGGWVQENPVQSYSVVTQRDGQEVKVKWLPRKEEKVPCWELKTFEGRPVPRFSSR